jgi:type I restriction enzyme, S subunit
LEVKEASVKYLARTRYKQTDAGLIPEDWSVEPFQSLARIERGKFTARPRNDPKYFGGQIPFIQTGDVANANGWINTYSQTLNQAGLKVSKLFPKGTLFFTIAANIGDVGFAAFDTACPDSLVAITAVKGVDKRWLAHELRIRKPSFENLASHNAQRNINLEKLRPYLLPVPTLLEQEAIGEALDDADAFIKSLEQLLAKKRQIKQGAMQELLTAKKRLPGFSGAWEEKPLGQVADVIKGRGLSRADVTSSATRQCILYGELFTVYGQTITHVVSRTDSEEGLLSVSGDVLMPGSTTTTGIDLATASALLVDGVLLGGDINVIRRKAQAYEATFLANYLTHAKRSAIAEIAQGITIHHLYGRDLRHLPLHLPPLSEQTAIAAVLKDMDEDVAVLEAKLTKALQLKRGMLQELLTGKVRLT